MYCIQLQEKFNRLSVGPLSKAHSEEKEGEPFPQLLQLSDFQDGTAITTRVTEQIPQGN